LSMASGSRLAITFFRAGSILALNHAECIPVAALKHPLATLG